MSSKREIEEMDPDSSDEEELARKNNNKKLKQPKAKVFCTTHSQDY